MLAMLLVECSMALRRAQHWVPSPMDELITTSSHFMRLVCLFYLYLSISVQVASLESSRSDLSNFVKRVIYESIGICESREESSTYLRSSWRLSPSNRPVRFKRQVIVWLNFTRDSRMKKLEAPWLKRSRFSLVSCCFNCRYGQPWPVRFTSTVQLLPGYYSGTVKSHSHHWFQIVPNQWNPEIKIFGFTHFFKHLIVVDFQIA
jgi:hypothetical protein